MVIFRRFALIRAVTLFYLASEFHIIFANRLEVIFYWLKFMAILKYIRNFFTILVFSPYAYIFRFINGVMTKLF